VSTKARRPIAPLFRKTADAAVRVCVRRGISPDAVSCLSILASAGAAAAFWQARAYPWLFLAAPALCYVRLWLNMLDGMVALASGKASRRGEIFNELPDRISDVLIFAGVAHSGLCAPTVAYWAAILALLTAYVGTLGQAVGARREYGGLMSKPWRMVALHAGLWAAWGLGPDARLQGLRAMDVVCLGIILGCVQTVAVRLSRIFRTLRDQEGLSHEPADDDRARLPDGGRGNPVLPGLDARAPRA
jgi:phosphatidylglycerophosphate synthase